MRAFAYIHILLSLITTGCSLSTITIEVMKPAKNQVDTQMVVLGVASRIDVNTVTVPVNLNGQAVSNYKKAVELAANGSVKSLSFDLNEIGRFEAVKVKSGALHVDSNPFEKPSNLDQICKAYRLDGVVALESFDAEVDIDTYTAFSSPVDRNEGTVRVPVFYNNQSVNLETLWTLYKCPTGERLHSKSISSQSVYQSESDNPYEAADQLPEGSMSLVEVAKQNASGFTKEISPYWSKEVRQFYIYGNDDLYRAGSYALDGYWEDATDIWYQLTNSTSERIAERAKYNMILASEVSGDYELAKEWAKKVIADYKNDNAVKYLEIIQRRMTEVERIDF